MKLSLCNEVIRELSFERQCALAAGLGYRGLELAPFTFGDDAWRMPAAKRAEIRKVCADNGLEVSGLHWLLAAPAGLSITSADRAVWQKSVDVLRASVDLAPNWAAPIWCTARRRSGAWRRRDDASRAEEAWMLAGEQAALAKVAYCIEPLARARLQFRQYAGRSSRDRAPDRQSGAAHHGRYAGCEPDGARAGSRCHPALDADAG